MASPDSILMCIHGKRDSQATAYGSPSQLLEVLITTKGMSPEPQIMGIDSECKEDKYDNK